MARGLSESFGVLPSFSRLGGHKQVNRWTECGGFMAQTFTWDINRQLTCTFKIAIGRYPIIGKLDLNAKL